MGRHLPRFISFLRTEQTMRNHLKSERLLLRPFGPSDAEAVQVLLANEKIARMTSRIADPYPDGAAALRIASHAEASARDEEHTFCIEQAGAAMYFLDNPASGRVLERLGFVYTGKDSEWSEARGRDVVCRRLELTRDRIRQPSTAS